MFGALWSSHPKEVVCVCVCGVWCVSCVGGSRGKLVAKALVVAIIERRPLAIVAIEGRSQVIIDLPAIKMSHRDCPVDCSVNKAATSHSSLKLKHLC